MLKKELKKLIKDSRHKEWLEGLEHTFDFKVGRVSFSFVGFYEIYFFVTEERKKWEKGDELEEIAVFNTTKSWLRHVSSCINSIALKLQDEADLVILKDIWRHNMSSWGVPDEKLAFLRDFSETQLIIELHAQNAKYGRGAMEMFSNQIDISSLEDSDTLYGIFRAYAFRSSENAELHSRESIEKENLNLLRAELGNLLNQTKEKITLQQERLEHFDQAQRMKLEGLQKKAVNDIEDLSGAHQAAISKLETSTSKTFEDMDNARHAALKKLVDETDERFKKHEETYEKKLQLEKPAEYWETRSKDLLKVANWWLVGLVAASLAGLTLIIWLIFSLKEDHIAEHINNPAISIRWSILSIILLTLIAFLVRVFTKMMMSNFHLYRDAQERKQLTYFYLALSNNTEVSDADRSIILQSLFSRVDTGLLKDDSGPTMPAGVIDKLNNQG